MKNELLDNLALFLLVLGGFNWLLVVWTDFNLITSTMNGISWLPKFFYLLVGLSAVYGVWMLIRDLV